MAQDNPGNINPTTTSGAALAAALSAFFTSSLPTMFSGTSRPAWASEGLIYLRTNTSPAHYVLCGAAVDGSQDIPLFSRTGFSENQVFKANAQGIIVPVAISVLTEFLSVMTGASSGVAGVAGIVPAPSAGQQESVLSGAATWVERARLGQFKTGAVKTENYTPVIGDLDTLLVMNSASSRQFTIPPDVFPQWAVLPFLRIGGGDVTIAGGTGVAVNQEENKFKLEFQFSACAAIQYAENTWSLHGRMKA